MLNPKALDNKILALFKERGIDFIPLIYKNAAAPEGSFGAFSTAEAFLLGDDAIYIVPGTIDIYLQKCSCKVFQEYILQFLEKQFVRSDICEQHLC